MIKNILLILILVLGFKIYAQNEPLNINSIKLKIDKKVENKLDKTWDSLKTVIPQNYSSAIIRSKKPRSIFFENKNFYFFASPRISQKNAVVYYLVKINTEAIKVSNENIDKLWEAQSELQFELMTENSYKDEMDFNPVRIKDGFKFYSVENFYFTCIESLLKYLGNFIQENEE